MTPRIIVDISHRKLEFARNLGATHTFLFDSTALRAQILEVTGGKGADLVVEASGNRSAMEAALPLARDKGGRALLAGNMAAGEKISVDPFQLIYGRTLLGTAGGESRLDEDIARFGAMKFPVEKLLGERYPLTEVNKAMERLHAGALGRILLCAQ